LEVSALGVLNILACADSLPPTLYEKGNDAILSERRIASEKEREALLLPQV
jgi:hypothetical protein